MGCVIVCAPQIVVSLGLVLVHFLLVWGSTGLVRFEFEVWVPFRFPGKPVFAFPYYRWQMSRLCIFYRLALNYFLEFRDPRITRGVIFWRPKCT